MSAMRIKDYVVQNSNLKREIRELEKQLEARRRKSICFRLRLAFRAFLKELVN